MHYKYSHQLYIIKYRCFDDIFFSQSNVELNDHKVGNHCFTLMWSTFVPVLKHMNSSTRVKFKISASL